MLHAQVARLQHRLQDGELAVWARGRGRGRGRRRGGLQDGELAVDRHEDGLKPVA